MRNLLTKVAAAVGLFVGIFVVCTVMVDRPAYSSNVQQPITISGTINDAVIIGTGGRLVDSGLPFVAACGTFQCVTGTLSSSDILSLNTTPVTIIPAPGTGKLIMIDRAALELIFGGTAYTGAGANPLLAYASATGATAACAGTFLIALADTTCQPGPSNTPVGASANVVNNAIQIRSAAPVITGNGTLRYWASYHVLSGL